MKRIFMLGVGLLISFLLFAACDTDEQPYRQYIRAYQRLQQEDSLVLQNNERLSTSGDFPGGAEESRTDSTRTVRLARGEAGVIFIADIHIHVVGEEPMQVKLYYRDGYLYLENLINPEENYRSPREDNFIMRSATEGILDFPQSVIARQSAGQTEVGLLLTFEMDSEKFYEYRFPPSSSGESYGESQTYREPPLYTVLLDEEGRFKQISGHFCTVNNNSTAFTWEQSYTIEFCQYGGVELDFPTLDDAQFSELPY